MSVLMQLDFEAARAETRRALGPPLGGDPVAAAYEACLDLANCLDDVAKTRDVPTMLGAAVRCVAEWLRRGEGHATTGR